MPTKSVSNLGLSLIWAICAGGFATALAGGIMMCTNQFAWHECIMFVGGLSTAIGFLRWGDVAEADRRNYQIATDQALSITRREDGSIKSIAGEYFPEKTKSQPVMK